MSKWILPALIALAFAGCGGGTTVAHDRAEQGAPCQAAELHEGTAAEQATFVEECRMQKDREAASKEDHAVEEAQRELERTGG